MNYRKLIKSVTGAREDNSLTAFALIAGLAAGAVIAALFAPRSGRETRKRLAERFSSASDHTQHDFRKAQLDDLRETTRQHADHLQGPLHKRKDPTTIKIPSAGTTAWKSQQHTSIPDLEKNS